MTADDGDHHPDDPRVRRRPTCAPTCLPADRAGTARTPAPRPTGAARPGGTGRGVRHVHARPRRVDRRRRASRPGRTAASSRRRSSRVSQQTAVRRSDGASGSPVKDQPRSPQLVDEAEQVVAQRLRGRAGSRRAAAPRAGRPRRPEPGSLDHHALERRSRPGRSSASAAAKPPIPPRRPPNSAVKHFPRSAALPAPRRAGRRSSPPASSRPPATRSRSRGGTAAAAARRRRRRRSVCSSVVIHQEKCWARQTRAGTCRSSRRAASVEPSRSSRSSASASTPHVGHGEVEALGAGGRHDVGGVAGEEQAAVPHRLGHEAAHRRDALLDDRPVGSVKPGRSPGGPAARPRSRSSGQSASPRPAAPAGRAG